MTDGDFATNLADLRQAVKWNMWICCGLGGLITLMVASLVYRLWPISREARRTPLYLALAEKHGEITDAQRQRVEDLLSESTAAINRSNYLIAQFMTDNPPKPKSGASAFFPVLLAGVVCVLVGGHRMTAVEVPTRRAVPDDRPALAKVPETGLVARGWKFMRLGDHRTASALLEEAANAGGDPTLTLGAAAECYYYLGDFGKALSLCDRLAEADPTSGRSAYVRGLVLLRQGKKAEAREEFRVAVRRGESLAATLLPATA